MKRVPRIQPKPTKEEETILNNHFMLPGWQFDALIGKNCTEISKQIIYWKGAEPQYAIIYGLEAVKTV